MAKRGESGLSFIIGVDKPSGLSSHDVVNVCRRTFGERRIGHAGTLDPLAQGVLPVCVGPATRLNDYLSAQSKDYRFTVCFGVGTSTDDRGGEIISKAHVPDEVCDPFFAQSFVAGLVGLHEQIPPRYSAIKVAGKRAYSKARSGDDFDLKPRIIEVYDAQLISINCVGESHECTEWEVQVSVSKGTYIRSLARDIGEAVESAAHVGLLERTRVGAITLDRCMGLEQIESGEEPIILDPVKLLDLPAIRSAPAFELKVTNGSELSCEELFSGEIVEAGAEIPEQLNDGTMLSLVVGDALKALYRYDDGPHVFRAQCVLSVGVSRG